MKLAVMQPYIFPYIGYFQLINAVDTFVFYDDVNFIKQGWVNRNRILVNGNDFMFTVPLQKVSPNKLILESYIHKQTYIDWKDDLLATIVLNYKKAPEFEHVYEMLNTFLNLDFNSISEMAMESIKMVSAFIGIQQKFLVSSETYKNKGLEKQERLIAICKQEKANHYINMAGGKDLYNKEIFSKEGIKLDFIQSLPIEYKQFNNEFIPWLSIIDVLMFNKRACIKEMLDRYELA